MSIDASVFREIGEKIQFLRMRKAWSQEELASRAGITLNTLGEAEAGKRKTSFLTINKLASALGVPVEELTSTLPHPHRETAEKNDGIVTPESPLPGPLYLGSDDWGASQGGALASLLGDPSKVTPGSTARAVHEWLITPPPQKVDIAAGRRIGEALVSKVEKRVVQLRLLDDFVGGRDLLMIVEKEVALTGQLLNEAAYNEVLGRRLLVAIGELCQLASWVAADAGAHAKATQYVGVGIKAAHAADDRALAANLISTLAYFRTNIGKIDDGILYAQTAIHGGARGASAATVALFRERAAWALACAGQQRQAELALAAVESDFLRSKPDEDPEWVYWLNTDEIEVMAARCFIKLGQPKLAVEKLTKIISRYDQRMTREAALYTSWLSEAHILDRNIEEAAHYALLSAELTSRTSSARSDDRVVVLAENLRDFASTPAVRDFLETTADLGYLNKETGDAAPEKFLRRK